MGRGGSPVLVGFFWVRLDSDRRFAVFSCGMRPDLCGQGYASALVHRAIERSALDFPDVPLVLHVRPFNASAIRLYKKCGFAESAALATPTMIGMLRVGVGV